MSLTNMVHGDTSYSDDHGRNVALLFNAQGVPGGLGPWVPMQGWGPFTVCLESGVLPFTGTVIVSGTSIPSPAPADLGVDLPPLNSTNAVLEINTRFAFFRARVTVAHSAPFSVHMYGEKNHG